MEKRFYVQNEVRKQIKNELLSQDLTLDDISRKLNSNFRNFIYKGTSLDKESFQKLDQLYNPEIEYEIKYFLDGAGFQRQLEVSRDEKLAELVGYMLGDGCISAYRDESKNFSNYFVSLTFHEDEVEQRKKVIELFKICLDYEPSVENPSSQKIIHLKAYGKRFVELFESIGLERGNKVENQISVPKWIYEKEKFMVACLRGLIDTDGSIYERSEDGYTVVNFKNRSKSLLNDFTKLNTKIGIKSSLAGEYDRQIASQDEVTKFEDKVKPIKSCK